MCLHGIDESCFGIFKRFPVFLELSSNSGLVLVKFTLKLFVFLIINLSVVEFFFLVFHSGVHCDEDLRFQLDFFDDFLLLSVVMQLVLAEHDAVGTNPDFTRHTNNF